MTEVIVVSKSVGKDEYSIHTPMKDGCVRNSIELNRAELEEFHDELGRYLRKTGRSEK